MAKPILDDMHGASTAADPWLVSMSDLEGRIVYANQALARVCGCAVDDLIGQPHSVLRHAEVPRAVFADLWATIQTGQPWIGVIQNRAGDGTGFWSRLSVTPMRDGAQMTGYLAVQTAASACEIAAAQRVFASVRAGTGRVVRGEWLPGFGWQRLRQLGRRSLWAQHLMALVGLIGLAWGLLWLALPWGAQLGLSCAVLTLLGVGLAWRYQRQVVRPMRQLLVGARQVAAGMLTPGLGGLGETEPGQVARALEQLTMSLMGVLGEVRSEAVGIRDTTDQVAQGGLHLSDRTEQQAANLEQTSAAMQQFSQSTSDNAYATAQASGIAMTMSSQAKAGGQAVQRVVETIRELEVSSRRIGDIIGVIDGIAFRTNILALNAAVEAGRAGPEGRGFAVVAGEVRSLAQRSANAAREIKVLIEESVRRVDAAVGIVHNAGAAMDQTVDSVGKVSRLIEEISAATGGQASEIEQVTAAVRQLDEMTQQNAALVEESAASAESLKKQADRLVGLAGVFQLNGSA